MWRSARYVPSVSRPVDLQRAIILSRYQLVDLSALPALSCPCGETRRAFTDDEDRVASMHLVEIHDAAQLHYHKRMTEFYYILQGTGELELDGTRHAVSPGMAIMIKPGCRHRAIGRMTLLNIPVPAFDPDDEWFD